MRAGICFIFGALSLTLASPSWAAGTYEGEAGIAGVTSLRHFKAYCNNLSDYKAFEMIRPPHAYIPILPTIEIVGDELIVTTRHHFLECTKFTANSFKFVPADRFRADYRPKTHNASNDDFWGDKGREARMDKNTGVSVHRHKLKKFFDKDQFAKYNRKENIYGIHLSINLWAGNLQEFVYHVILDFELATSANGYSVRASFL